MKNPDSGIEIFDPVNLVFDSESVVPKILGYFSNGVINKQTSMNYGLYQPKSAIVNPLLTNGVVKQPAINLITSHPITID
ncbi:MAG: hypothetical protein RSB95_04930 [Bacilli bacterium]